MQEITLSNNLQQIEFDLKQENEQIGKSIWKIGCMLKHVKENDLAHGQFMEWYKNLGYNKNFVSKAITIANELSNFPTLGNIGTEALYLIATLPEEEKQAQLEKVEQGDNPTIRELQDLKRKLKESEERNKRLAEQALQKEVIEKEVVVEKVPDDYRATKQLNSALLDKNRDLQRQYEDAKSRNDFVEMQLKDLYEQRAEVDEKSAKYDELTRAIEQSRGQLDEYQKSIGAYKDVLSFLKKGNQFLSNFGGLVYVDVKPALANQQVKSELETFSVMINSLSREVNNLLSENEILEGEIL